MEYQEFVEEVVKGIRERTGKEVTAMAVRKNNGVLMDGLLVREEGINISPIIYLEPHYRFYLAGMELEAVIENIHAAYLESRPTVGFETECFADFERAKERIVFKLVNYEKNREALEGIPHKKYLDLAVVFGYLVDGSGDVCQAMALLKNEHLDYWGVHAGEIEELAYENTPRLLGHSVARMSDVLAGCCGEAVKAEIIREETARMPELLILTNRSKFNGAGCILYPGVLAGLAEKMGCDFIILPSSVHEVILIPVKEDKISDRKQLCRMICEVNEMCVSDMDILSDHPYLYERETGQITKM